MSLIGKRVLVVDDNATNRFILSEQLRSLGISSVAAPSGRDAMVLASECPFDAAILDYQMPEMEARAASLTQLPRVRGLRFPLVRFAIVGA